MLDTRRAHIGDAAIELVAREGMRGLTHRGVDRAAGLSPGSTSYYARTRLALVELAIQRMVELDEVELGRPADADALARALAGLAHHAMTDRRQRTLARYELALEATRRPELRAVYDAGGSRLREQGTALLAELGSDEPERHLRMLIAWSEGVLFDAVAGAGEPPSRAELVDSAADLLAACFRARRPRPAIT